MGGVGMTPRISGWMVVMFTERRKIVREIGFERQKAARVLFCPQTTMSLLPLLKLIPKTYQLLLFSDGAF